MVGANKFFQPVVEDLNPRQSIESFNEMLAKIALHSFNV
jgi:hypothetical protein